VPAKPSGSPYMATRLTEGRHWSQSCEQSSAN
jgi:hypothetical protein